MIDLTAVNLTEIEAVIVTCLPALTAVITIIASVKSVLKSLNKLKDNEALKAERDALAEQNKKILREMRAQKRQVALLIEKAVKIKYNDLDEVKNDEDLQV